MTRPQHTCRGCVPACPTAAAVLYFLLDRLCSLVQSIVNSLAHSSDDRASAEGSAAAGLDRTMRLAALLAAGVQRMGAGAVEAQRVLKQRLQNLSQCLAGAVAASGGCGLGGGRAHSACSGRQLSLSRPRTEGLRPAMHLNELMFFPGGKHGVWVVQASASPHWLRMM